MRRFGSTESFLDLLGRARDLAPDLGAPSTVIVGFPGETESDLAELERFLVAARLDAIGVFGYSDEEGTDAAAFDGKLPSEEIQERVARVSSLADELVAQRAEERVGAKISVLIDEIGEDGVVGRAAHQGPDTDGVTFLTGTDAVLGSFVPAVVVESDGVDLVADAAGPAW